jgi:A/G-specific adenine glycosylase
MDIYKLEAWYLKNQRKLPFRESKNSYHIWVSEVMLQQTQVDTVLPYFSKFIEKYPTVLDLANANEEELHKTVEGLGYYRRFRMMHQAAITIMRDFKGVFPDQYEHVRSLPGVGAYTAGAIMSIAYNQPFSATDGNVIRVLARYLGDDQDMRLEKNKKRMDIYQQQMIEKATPWIYTQAIMELGALICRPRQPKCDLCPLQEHCQSYQQDIQDQIPLITRPLKTKVYHYITLVIEDQEAIYLRKRHEELLKGMYEYPQYESESLNFVLNELEQQGIVLDIYEEKTAFKHVFSHQTWLMDVYHARRIKGSHPEWIRISKHDIFNYPMAIAHRKIKLTSIIW